MSKSLNETLAEIEDTQASLAKTIEDSRRLINRSQQLLDCHRKKLEEKQKG